MASLDMKNAAAGGVLAAAGLIYAGYAATYYRIGTVREMGPGMFPLGLGVLLAFLGVLLLLSSLSASTLRGEAEEPDTRSALCVLGSIAIFAVTAGTFGLVPAVVLLTVVASFATTPFRLKTVLLLAATISAMAALVFVYALGLFIPLFRWPF